ncbi:MAG TPA: molybdenum cofactor guanylyltransferase [Candidatus Acidoferrum sp.]|nr:molybdenum cofactor guanylyltransferase [Candidatus Acidoferrum sp.]
MAGEVSAFVLAGGKSTRMGTDKAFVTLDGRTLLQRALETARSITPDVWIVGDPAKYASFAPCVPDLHPNCGPLGGIHAALRSSQTELNLMLAVDLPFVTAGLLQFVVARANSSELARVTVPRAAGRLQPLCAVYRRDFAAAAEQAFREKRYKIDALFDAQRTDIIEEDVLESAGFPPMLFRNLNTPEDLAHTK